MSFYCLSIRYLICSFCLTKSNYVIFIALCFCQITFATPNSTEKTYLTWEDVKCNNSSAPDCYLETYNNILSKTVPTEILQNKDLNLKKQEESKEYTRTVNDYSIMILQKKMPKTVIVTIHGLWGRSNQFLNVLKENKKQISTTGYNTIHLTLPGHMKLTANDSYNQTVKTNRSFATFKQWLVALEETLLLAQHLGENVVIMGQSTGGLLATIAALKYPQLIDQVLLVEPALQVNALMNFGACLSDNPIPQSFVESLGSLLGIYVPNRASISMGCEVQKLADTIFKRNFGYIKDKGRHQQHKYFEDLSVYREIAKQIQIPVLMINNENDKIGSAKVNQAFYDGLLQENKMYVSINNNRAIHHGRITSLGLFGTTIIEFFRRYGEQVGLKVEKSKDK